MADADKKLADAVASVDKSISNLTQGSKTYSVNDIRYRIYSILWCSFSGIRIFLKKIKIKLKRRLR